MKKSISMISKLCSFSLVSITAISLLTSSVFAVGNSKNSDNDKSTNASISNDHSQVVLSNIPADWKGLFDEIKTIQTPEMKRFASECVREDIELSLLQDICNSPARLQNMKDEDLEQNIIDTFTDATVEFVLPENVEPMQLIKMIKRNIVDRLALWALISSDYTDSPYYKVMCCTFKLGFAYELGELYCLCNGWYQGKLHKKEVGSYLSLEDWCKKENKSFVQGIFGYASYLNVLSYN